MRYLFDDWRKIEGIIRKSPRILLLTDYDGTLTPIVSRPKEAILSNLIRNILRSLLGKRKFFIGIVSGRRLVDVKRLVRLKNIYYVGGHGLEIYGPKIRFVHPSLKRFKPYLDAIKKELVSKITPIKGAIVEYKAGSISLHYRLVRKSNVKRLRAIFRKACAPYVKRGKIRLLSGKKIWEARVGFNWNKGSAVGKISNLLGGKKALTIYLGDDKTDEDAFSFLKRKRSLTIFVGKKRKTKAKYYLKSPLEVKRFLIMLCQT